ncbi:hypothetical protein Agub_g1656, partial [Astrephomene gubernaculifera]
LAAMYGRQRRRNRNLLGRVRAPGVGPHTTLLITDIESSTTLWEELPGNVMEQAMEMHDVILRGLAADHDGYESANEGDSFVLAFHTPHEAVLFALKAQQQLLLAAWPELLLKHEKAEAVWMSVATEGSGLAAACGLSTWCGELLGAAHTKAIKAHSAWGPWSQFGPMGQLSAASALGIGAHSLQRSFLEAARLVRRRLFGDGGPMGQDSATGTSATMAGVQQGWSGPGGGVGAQGWNGVAAVGGGLGFWEGRESLYTETVGGTLT